MTPLRQKGARRKAQRPARSDGFRSEPSKAGSVQFSEPRLSHFVTAVIQYRMATSASVISWGRTEDACTGHPNDPRCGHLVDLAVDVRYDQHITLDAALTIGRRLGLAVHRLAGYDHLEPFTPGG